MTDTNRTTTQSKPASKGAKARKAAKSAIDSASAKVRDGAHMVRVRAYDATEAASAALEGNPLAALAGAVAVGAAAAAIIPSTRAERSAVGPLGDRVRGALDTAVKSAKAAGTQQLTAKGLTTAAATSTIGGIIGGVVKAVIEANTAAPAKKPKSTQPAPAPQGS